MLSPACITLSIYGISPYIRANNMWKYPRIKYISPMRFLKSPSCCGLSGVSYFSTFSIIRFVLRIPSYRLSQYCPQLPGSEFGFHAPLLKLLVMFPSTFVPSHSSVMALLLKCSKNTNGRSAFWQRHTHPIPCRSLSRSERMRQPPLFYRHRHGQDSRCKR